ncbi:PREDICTED: uncharacterized protein LOC109153449 [Ipomoea nil]|uniref:uncharacterized protein LOC109153449 n=1 Tax=Ipomoea nil TaxID=35883 RepID=UPI000901B2FD|nr:PREDICTED: uncharacterized protein LOC109153449 [Ipomoea nil]
MATGPSNKQQISSSSSSSSSPSSSSTLSSMKLKTLLQTFIFSHLYRIARAVAKAKSILLHLLKDIHVVHLLHLPLMTKKSNKNKHFLGSFRLHYNWCSSHVAPVPMPEEISGGPTAAGAGAGGGRVYYDPTWNSFLSAAFDREDPKELSGYLHWLEEKGREEPNGGGRGGGAAGNNGDDIDRLADMFIANSHERFRLEKVESYRRFQEMLARSV